jgi:amino acid adenylation domain-containing protein
MHILAQKQEILRTTFSEMEGRPVQVIGKKANFEVTTFDVENLPAEKRLWEANALALKEARRSFDLGRGPLVRITLIRLREDDHLMLITMHHIITDRWSMEVLYRELAKIYQALGTGLPAQADEPRVQYADFASWQRSQMPDENHMAYWKKKLGGELPMLNLPSDYTRPVRPSFAGGLAERSFDRRLGTQLKDLAKTKGTTSFVLLLAAFKVLLYRYSRQEDILVGTPFSNRDRSSLENVIGFFNDTLVLRSDLSGDPRFVDLLEQVRQTVMEAFNYRNMPFELLVKTLAPERDLATNPIFQVMFLYDKASTNASFAPGLDVNVTPFDFGVSKFDLTLYVSEEEESFTAILEYARDIFAPATIERMHDHLEQLLQNIVADPESRVSSLSLLTDSERSQLLDGWNATATVMPPIPAINMLFDKQVRDQPRKPALIFRDEMLGYEELSARADILSARLLKIGCQGSIIGLCTHRSVDMIVGILAILKAGAAYLPLDPEYPVQRLHYMVKDAAVKIILAQEGLAGLFDGVDLIVRTFEFNPESPDTTVSPELRPITSEDLAYVIYTSGSTGKPKGVAVTHGNLVHSTLARESYYGEPPSSFLLLSSYAFDSSVAGIFWTLCTGGTLILAEHHIEQDMHRLADLVARHKVTHTLMLPSLYALMLQQAPSKKLASLEVVIVAGEACSSALCRNHLKILSTARLYNEYGPTEATVWCTVHKISQDDILGPVPVGRPIANTQAYILDQLLQPVPVGVAGELFIGGDGVAWGYLNNHEQTSRAFIPNPFSQDPAQRLYRTGDLARFRANGLIDYLGRADQQIKIRGYRVELDEIREAILNVTGVRDAEVVIRDDESHSEGTTDESGQLVDLLQALDPAEAERILRTIERLSGDRNEDLLTKTMNPQTFPA